MLNQNLSEEIAEYMEVHHIHIKPAMFFFLAVVKEMLSEVDEEERHNLLDVGVFFLMDK